MNLYSKIHVKSIPQYILDALISSNSASGTNPFITQEDLKSNSNSSVVMSITQEEPIVKLLSSTSQAMAKGVFHHGNISTFPLDLGESMEVVLKGKSAYGNTIKVCKFKNIGELLEIVIMEDSAISYKFEARLIEGNISFIVYCELDCDWELWL